MKYNIDITIKTKNGYDRDFFSFESTKDIKCKDIIKKINDYLDDVPEKIKRVKDSLWYKGCKTDHLSENGIDPKEVVSKYFLLFYTEESL